MSEPSREGSAPQPNEALRAARLRTESPAHPGQCLSRQELGELVAAHVYHHHGATVVCDANWVGKLERGEITWPHGPQRQAFRAVLGAPSDHALGFTNQRRPAQQLVPTTPAGTTDPYPPTATGTAGRTGDAALLEPPAQILERIHRTGPVVAEEYLRALDSFVADIVDRYETEGPRRLAPEVIHQRRQVHDLLVVATPSRRGFRLMRSAAQLSAQLAYMGVNLGQFGPAGAYAAEAYQLADEIDDHDLKAWVRGTQSFAAYYRQRYADALDYARDGLRHAGNGPQAVRLTINGEARALAQLHQHTEAEHAISRATQLLQRFTPDDGMTPCISFDLYSEARTVSNAATAYLALGDNAQALDHTGRVLDVVDRSDSTWSKALVRLDAATAQCQTEHPDLDHAVHLVRTVRHLTKATTLESIRQRLHTCLAALRQWKNARVVAELLDELEANPGR